MLLTRSIEVPNAATKYFFDNFHLTTPYFYEKIFDLSWGCNNMILWPKSAVCSRAPPPAAALYGLPLPATALKAATPATPATAHGRT